ncbi:BTB domain-containing protein [Favolaschia claudopus]|uniref:BTB domain-containing protein n=1 Tax=Favolaschia claudopus TaxID=2862362 RepID=A0AAW0AVS2_9AGAR
MDLSQSAEVDGSVADGPVTQVEDLWFATDMIVIRAEDKAFRVPAGILAARSSVFRDMISLPPPTNDAIENMDGIPIVHLHDSADDVAAFLRAIYDSRYAFACYHGLFLPAPAPIDFSVVLGILRLSHKYDVQYLYRRSLEHLRVDGWYAENYDEDDTAHLLNGLSNWDYNPLIPLQVICDAGAVGALWLLPIAYYCLSASSGEDLLPLLDGKFAHPVGKALAARGHMVRVALATHRFAMPDDSSCYAPSTCDTARSMVLAQRLDEVSEPRLNPVTPNLEATTMEKLNALGMCSDCRAVAKAVLSVAATAFWDELPGLFGLPPWAELYAMKRTAMGEDIDGEVRHSDEAQAS